MFERTFTKNSKLSVASWRFSSWPFLFVSFCGCWLLWLLCLPKRLVLPYQTEQAQEYSLEREEKSQRTTHSPWGTSYCPFFSLILWWVHSFHVYISFRGPGLASEPPELTSLRKFPNLVVSNVVVCNFYAEVLFCAPLRPFTPFYALLHSCVYALLLSFALFCAHLRVSASDRV